MDTNIAAWMIAGGPQLEHLHDVRDREQLHALRESQRVERPGLIDRLRGVTRRPQVEADLVCCAA